MTLSEGAPVAYHSFDGDDLTLHPWAGEHVALLAASTGLDADVMTRIVAGLDGAYEVYAAITGRAPDPFLTYEGRLSIAEVPTTFGTVGGALGYLGATGIEVTPPPFDAIFGDVQDRNRYDQAMFYELGRNFWFYGDQLSAVDPFVTGYAIVNRFVSMEVAGLRGGPFGSIPFAEFKSSILDGLPEIFFSSDTYTLQNTLGTNTAIANPHGWGTTDFAASLFYEVYQNFGFDAYARFFHILGARPAAGDEVHVYANLIAAASAATGFDFGFLDKPAGVSYVVGGAEDDRLVADGSPNPVIAGGGNDVLKGRGGDDRLLAGAGDDFLHGKHGGDVLVGGLGRDELNGGAGDDTLIGGPRGDVLIGGGGADRLSGGEGANTYVYRTANDSGAGVYDTIEHFETRHDRILLPQAITGVDAQVDAGTSDSFDVEPMLAAAVDPGHLAAHHAVVATIVIDTGDPGSSIAIETFLIIDANGQAGYQTGEDLAILMGQPIDLSGLDVDNFLAV